VSSFAVSINGLTLGVVFLRLSKVGASTKIVVGL